MMSAIQFKIVTGYAFLCVLCIAAHIGVKKGYDTLCNQNLVHYYFMKDANVCVNLKSWIVFFEDICTFSIDILLLSVKTHMTTSLSFVKNILDAQVSNLHKTM